MSPPPLPPPIDASDAALLKRDRGREVWRCDETLVKTWPLTLGVLARWLVGRSQAQRQIRGARRLIRLNLATPEPLDMHWRRTIRGIALVLRLRFVPGEEAMAYLRRGDGDTATLAILAERLGAAIAAIADAGLVNRDMKLANVVIRESAGGPEAWLIDPVGVRRFRDPVMARVRMLERLGVQLRELDEADRPVVPRPAWFRLLRAAWRGLSRQERHRGFERLRRLR